MEFLRFGSSIPGSYWGCCAMDIIQDFKHSPDEKASIQLVCGDGGQPLGDRFLGMTHREVFNARMRISTFSTDDQPNHGFLAILTDEQLRSSYGAAWLAILKEHGFEFIRTVSNSVYAGQTLFQNDGWCEECQSTEGCEEEWCEYQNDMTDMNLNHLFGLFRNIGNGKVNDPLKPPSAWANLEGGVKSPSDYLTRDQRAAITASQEEQHLAMWEKIGPAETYTRDEVLAAGVTVTLAGQRSKFPQETEEARETTLKEQGQLKPAAPFATLGKEVKVVL